MVEHDNKLLKRFYIIENFETEFSRWTLTEFSHMLLILNGLYKKIELKSECSLIITNFEFLHDKNTAEKKGEK